MGKKKDKAHKKDKASKSNKKKHKQESVEQAVYEDTSYTGPESGNIQVATTSALAQVPEALRCWRQLTQGTCV